MELILPIFQAFIALDKSDPTALLAFAYVLMVIILFFYARHMKHANLATIEAYKESVYNLKEEMKEKNKLLILLGQKIEVLQESNEKTLDEISKSYKCLESSIINLASTIKDYCSWSGTRRH